MPQTTEKNTLIGTTVKEQYDYDDSIAVQDAYTTVLTVDARQARSVLITLRNTHASNVLTYRIDGSIKSGDSAPGDADTSWKNIRSDTDIAASTDGSPESTALPWAWLRVQMKNKVGGSAATASTRFRIRD